MIHSIIYNAATRGYSGSEFVEEIFKKDNSILIRIDDPKFADMQFILSTTAMKELDPDSFSIRWGAFSKNFGYNELPKLLFALQRCKNSEWRTFPITWLGKPTCEPTRKSWFWGNILWGDICNYYDDKINENVERTFKKLIMGKDRIVRWNTYTISQNFKYRFVANL